MRRLMGPVDAAWLHLDTVENPMVITGVLTFGRPLPWDGLRRLVQERMVDRWPPFRDRVVRVDAILPHWQPDERFDLDAHLHRLALPDPGDDAALQELVGDLASRPLDLRIAPWQVHLVDGFGAGCALVVRVHHCVADGLALARVLLSLADEGEPLPPSPTHPPPAGPVTDGQLAPLFDRLPDLARALRLSADATRELEHLLLMPADPPTPLKGPLGTVKRCAWTPERSVAALKAAARRRGCTINDLLMAALTGALEGWLGDAAIGVEQVRAFVPVDIRGGAPIPPELGNRFSMVLVPLPLGEPRPAVRVERLRAEMLRLRGSTEPAVVTALLQLVGYSPAFVKRLVVELMGAKASAIVTNVVGPTGPVHLLGVPLDRVLVWVPQAGELALGVAFFSYDGRLTVGINADAGVVPDPGALARRFDDALDVLLGAV